MKTHGNSHENAEPHHLYEIRDHERQEVYKFGICGEPLRTDGSSPRAARQVREFNRLVGWRRFYACILLENLAGRKLAEELEETAIADYQNAHGKRPIGNPPKKIAPTE